MPTPDRKYLSKNPRIIKFQIEISYIYVKKTIKIFTFFFAPGRLLYYESELCRVWVNLWKNNLGSKEGLYSYALLTILASKVWLLVRLVCGWEIFRSDCWGCIFIAFRRLSTQTLSPICGKSKITMWCKIFRVTNISKKIQKFSKFQKSRI